MADQLSALLDEIRGCRLCATGLPLGPRPIVQAGQEARVLIIGQAPGTKVHASGIPWDDDSGERLREWTGIDRQTFYDPQRIALMPMGFCYPGKGSSGDLPPRSECAPLWHAPLRASLPELRLTLLTGQYALGRYWPKPLGKSMTDAVRNHALGPADLFPLPHPSWRSTLWMRKNPWFEAEVLGLLRQKIATALRA
jgi:uracil-DNA glycosylase